MTSTYSLLIISDELQILIHIFLLPLIVTIGDRSTQVFLASALDDINGFLMEWFLIGCVQPFPGSILLDHTQQIIDFFIQGFNIVHLCLESLHPGIFPPTIVVTGLRSMMSELVLKGEIIHAAAFVVIPSSKCRLLEGCVITNLPLVLDAVGLSFLVGHVLIEIVGSSKRALATVRTVVWFGLKLCDFEPCPGIEAV
jgi:hypothetical protein